MFIDFRERETLIGHLPYMPRRGMETQLGMCPDWELNPQPLGEWDDAPTNWAPWPGLRKYFWKYNFNHSLNRNSCYSYFRDFSHCKEKFICMLAKYHISVGKITL